MPFHFRSCHLFQQLEKIQSRPDLSAARTASVLGSNSFTHSRSNARVGFDLRRLRSSTMNPEQIGDVLQCHEMIGGDRPSHALP